MASQLISALTHLLAELPISSVLRERVGLLKDQVESLEKRNRQLEQENTDLQSRLRELEISEADRACSSEFVEHRGALFKRKHDGGYEHAVYCPECHRSAFSMDKFFPYACDKCQWSADFTGRELDEVLGGLP
jgi:regulator of replication initiation timing